MMINKKGFTLIEIILVITLLAISLGLSSLYSQTTQLRADINTQVQLVVSDLRLVQSNANAGVTNKPNAMHFESSFYATFTSVYGSAYDSNDLDNVVTDLPPTIVLQNILLNGGGADIIFSSPKGETANYGSIAINSSQINKVIPINITTIGSISY